MPGEHVRTPHIDFNPPHYVCQRSHISLGKPDGRLDKPFWEQGEWISNFHDIEGDEKPRPWKETRVKLLWDENALYVGAKLCDDTIWADVSERDTIVFLDNDFEVFLSPKDTTHHYYEIEMNARNTVWDLMLDSPERDNARRVTAWDVHGLESAVHIDGKLNDPSADNRYWSLELVLPWFSLRECEPGELMPHRLAPAKGEIWRVNFSRVEYLLEGIDGKYRKRADPKTGVPYPECNWVWAPTGVIDIHMPEMWGYVMFADGPEKFARPAEEDIKWALRKCYYREFEYFREHGHFTDNVGFLCAGGNFIIGLRAYVTPSMFEVIAGRKDREWHIRQDGYLWKGNSW